MIPRDPGDIWRLAAALTSPVASAWLAGEALGTGMSARTLRVSAASLARIPLPVGALDFAAELLRRGDVLGCAAAVIDAYGVADSDRAELIEWWRPLAIKP